MNYEKKYRDLVEAVKELQEANPSDDGIQNWIKDNVPELIESESERTRKEIINYFQCQSQDEPSRKDIHNKWIAWLEKQGEKKTAIEAWKEMRLEVYAQASGNRHEVNCSDDKTKMFSLSDIDEIIEKISEQKPADKVEPKFKVGDIVKHNKANIICKVLSANVGLYRLVNILGGDEIELSNVEKSFHLWTIQDAKDGDVLIDNCKEYNNPFIFILKRFEKVDFGLAKLSDFSSYCYLTMSDNQKFKDGGYHHMHDIRPATKEQRELLFKYMKEAGYEWDSEHKQLKKIEQEYHCNGVREPKEATGVLKQLLNKENYAWSEEDENEYAHILKTINLVAKEQETKGYNNLNSSIKWLKHLKDRVQPQPKQEWSKEDVCNIQDIDSVLFYDKSLPEDTCMRLRNWLKSLKNKYTWKPNEEQMDCLNSILRFGNVSQTSYKHLNSLINDLKKLKG